MKKAHKLICFLQYSLCALLARFYLPSEMRKDATKTETAVPHGGLYCHFYRLLFRIFIFIITAGGGDCQEKCKQYPCAMHKCDR